MISDHDACDTCGHTRAAHRSPAGRYGACYHNFVLLRLQCTGSIWVEVVSDPRGGYEELPLLTIGETPGPLCRCAQFSRWDPELDQVLNDLYARAEVQQV